MTGLLRGQQEKTDDLLAWLSPALWVEPALLRAVRHRLSAADFDVGHEAAAWNHDDVVITSIGFYFQPATLAGHRHRLRQLTAAHPELAREVGRLVLAHHQHLFPTQRYEELLVLAQVMGDELDEHALREVETARRHMRCLIKASEEQHGDIPGLRPFRRYLLARQQDAVLASLDCYQSLWAMEQSGQGRMGTLTIPADWDVANIRPFLETAADERLEVVLVQEGPEGLSLKRQDLFEAGAKGFITGVPLARFNTSASSLLCVQEDTNHSVILSLPPAGSLPLPLSSREKRLLHFAEEEIEVERSAKPEWALAIGCDHQGLHVVTLSANGRHRWHWHPPELRNNEIWRGFWYSEQLPRIGPPTVPDWAEACQRDQYGLKARVALAGMTLWFRWIEPGSFVMGSPADEPGRRNNETQHKATLTQGFWLAETTVSQALWAAVKDDNPSRFQDDPHHPVEQVSWNNARAFIDRLNRAQPGLALRLPWETEWEYACRAGSATPFWWGMELSPEQANYDGNRPYHRGKKGQNWEKTVAVSSFAPNPWGLYQMHGNVWEWCQDWLGPYPSGPVIDPQGPDSGGIRVMRGGSWIDFGGICRSAVRFGGHPADRWGYRGFRLVRGHESGQAGSSSSAAREPSFSTSLKDTMHIRTHRIFPEHFPEPWASDWGEDEYGLWLAFTYMRARQGFRWIEPGSFLMGSPVDEPERDDDETQHEVTLTQGFWLAETTVSQALWTAVMDGNPSRFQDDPHHPVEQVSWDKALAFIDRLNRDEPGLALRLPWEAEWEYACRAGSATPFWWGRELNPKQANYSGNRPYHRGKKGQNREKTVTVSSFAPNPWGLDQMHGNVWEWCQDWWGPYPSGPVIDPQGPDSGEIRVLRGGSWIDGGRLCRSAYRHGIRPATRWSDHGFRLARGHEPVQVSSGFSAAREPSGSPADGARGDGKGDGRRSPKEKI